MSDQSYTNDMSRRLTLRDNKPCCTCKWLDDPGDDGNWYYCTAHGERAGRGDTGCTDWAR